MENDDITQAVTRQIILDLVPCAMGPNVISSLGLYPSSPEGQEVEHTMSHARLDKIGPLDNALQIYAAIIAEIRVRILANNAVPGSIPEEAYPQIFQASLITTIENTRTILAQMIDAGLIKVGEIT